MLQQKGHGAGGSGSPPGEFNFVAASGDTHAGSSAEVVQNGRQATVDANAYAWWEKVWQWQPDGPMDPPGTWLTISRGFNDGVLFADVGGQQMMQPTATARLNWYMEWHYVTATAWNHPVDAAFPEEQVFWIMSHTNQPTIDRTAMAIAYSHADRNAPGASWGYAESGTNRERVEDLDLVEAP